MRVVQAHRTDDDTQYLSMRSTERLAAAGIDASGGRRGDADDHALAESGIGWFTTEVIRHAGPGRSLDDGAYATRDWVAWCTTCRRLAPLGYRPPAAYARQFAQRTAAPTRREHATTCVSDEPGAVQYRFATSP